MKINAIITLFKYLFVLLFLSLQVHARVKIDAGPNPDANVVVEVVPNQERVQGTPLMPYVPAANRYLEIELQNVVDQNRPRLANSSSPSSGNSQPSPSKGDLQLNSARGPSGVENGIECNKLANPSRPSTQAIQANLVAACGQIIEIDKSCFAVFEKTNMICHTEKNESIANSITMIQSLMSVASGVTNACDNFGKAMDIAKKAMGLYTAACGAAQIACSSKCGGTVKALEKFSADIKKAQGEIGKAVLAEVNKLGPTEAEVGKIWAELNVIQKNLESVIAFAQKEATPAGGPSSVGTKAKICAVSVPEMLGAAVVNIGALIQGKIQSDNCKKDADAKVADSSCANPANKDRADCKQSDIVDCGKPENSDKPICICKANPRTTGCEGVSTKLATNSTLGTGNGSGMASNRGPSGKINQAGANAAEGKAFPDALKGNGNDGGGAAASGGGGGSSGGLSGSGGSGGSNSDKADAGGAKGSANILGGSEGGGGTGFKGSGYGGYSLPEYRSKLKAFASNNGIGAKLAGNGWVDQVTGTGGRSNFEKIKARYQENKSTLLGR